MSTLGYFDMDFDKFLDHASEIIDDFKKENGDLLTYRKIAREEVGPMLDDLYAQVAEEEAKRLAEEQALANS